MSTRELRLTPGKALGILAVAIGVVALLGPGAAGVDGSSKGASTGAHASSGSPGNLVLRTVVRVERSFTVAPHSLATDQLVRCPEKTLLTGGGTSLDGQPFGPGTAPIVYTNGPVGNIIAGEQQTWGSEVANPTGRTFHYVQFALCATTRSIPFGD